VSNVLKITGGSSFWRGASQALVPACEKIAPALKGVKLQDNRAEMPHQACKSDRCKAVVKTAEVAV
jgi:hypothetical protein